MFYKTYILFCLITVVLFFNVKTIAQGTPDPNSVFPLGVWATGEPETEATLYDKIDETGFNWIVQGVYPQTKLFLEDFNVITQNGKQNEWIYYYSNGKYKKWEAERDEYAFLKTGFKHPHPTPWGEEGPYLYGRKDTLTINGKDNICWATNDDVDFFVDSVLWGPNYTQEKNYKMLYYDLPIDYTVRYRLALLNAPANPQDTICKLYVRYHAYKRVNGEIEDTIQETLDSLYLLAEDLPGDTFHVKSLHYAYPEEYQNPYQGPLGDYPNPAGEHYDDDEVLTGIEFCLDFWGNGKLYVDYVEVYDDEIWFSWITEPLNVASAISSQLSNYPPAEWPNIKYWYVIDEPHSLDDYEPIRIIDSLVYAKSNNVWRTINQFQPAWNGFRNGDTTIQKFIELVNPERLMIDYFPFWVNETSAFGFDHLKQIFEFAALYSPEFYYVPQGFGQFINGTNFTMPCGWREPIPEELKASIMLALAFGSKGIHIWKFATNLDSHSARNCDDDVQWKCLAKTKEEGYEYYPLGQIIKDNIAPRLNSKLGKTLLTLDYTGDYINTECYNCPIQDNITLDYLTISQYGTNYFWHAGFLNQHNYTDNKYFLLANLRTNISVEAELMVSNNTGYENVSFTDIEGGSGRVDTTIGYNSSITYYETMPEGEGRLYRVAPVVKYGGRLIYNEDVGEGQTLTDEMIIKTGSTLTVYGNYTAQANIIVKDGSIVNGENGEIHFEDGMKLIIDGTATINGTSGDKLTLYFDGQDAEYGIVVNSAGSLTISNCIIEKAETGIKAELYAKYLNAQYVDFVDCICSSVTILGQMGGGETPPPQVKDCNISNSHYGIFAANLSTLVIQENNINNTDLGIYLSNVSNVAAIGNTIISSTEDMPGILATSLGGVIRYNYIEGHTEGIHLGNSSPDVGGNDITNCKLHGMHIGSGSLPNMVGRLVHNQNNHLWYPVSGYNKIYENGGYAGGGLDDDGSEILFSNANALMSKGCNLIYDDREPSGNLVDTRYLMSGSIFSLLIEVEAEYNFWGYEPPYPLEQRFNNLIVYYDPYYEEPCPLPDKSGEKLVTRTPTGTPIDTLYPVERSVGVLSENEILYSKADELFITGEIESAEVFYDQIISSNDTLTNKLEAYSRKYETGKLLKRNPEYFSELQNTYESLITTTEDSLLKKIFGQLSKLCLVSQEEYVPAIGEFDAIVQQNPGSEEAVYAEIDALTTALLVEGNDSTMNKGSLGKYLVKTSGDYFGKLDGILRKNFGSEKETEEKEILPKEYTLYQNYPNPFNPVTTIKYDLPNAGNAELVVYDILGRKVKELVNQTQQTGRYDIEFDASSLASGVYIYQLKTKDFVNSKKMILLK